MKNSTLALHTPNTQLYMLEGLLALHVIHHHAQTTYVQAAIHEKCFQNINSLTCDDLR